MDQPVKKMIPVWECDKGHQHRSEEAAKDCMDLLLKPDQIRVKDRYSREDKVAMFREIVEKDKSLKVAGAAFDMTGNSIYWQFKYVLWRLRSIYYEQHGTDKSHKDLPYFLITHRMIMVRKYKVDWINWLNQVEHLV